jgi:hypothetical protein
MAWTYALWKPNLKVQEAATACIFELYSCIQSACAGEAAGSCGFQLELLHNDPLHPRLARLGVSDEKHVR